jgi:hypothetical protein
LTDRWLGELLVDASEPGLAGGIVDEPQAFCDRRAVQAKDKSERKEDDVAVSVALPEGLDLIALAKHDPCIVRSSEMGPCGPERKGGEEGGTGKRDTQHLGAGRDDLSLPVPELTSTSHCRV